MGSFSLGHWLIVLLVVILLFGAGRIPNLMSDMAKGIKAFRSGMKDDDEKAADAQIEPPLHDPVRRPTEDLARRT